MILKNLKLRNWGVIKEETYIGFAPGMNIISGPNESGKSTVRAALVRAFFAKHNIPSSAAEFVPWGTDGLAPLLEVEFEDGGNSFRAVKRFMKDPDSQLETLDAGKWKSIAEGDKADGHLAAVLGGTPSPRAPKLENMGIIRALWTPQGVLGDMDGFDFGDAARSRLLAEVGGVVTTQAEGKMIKSLQARLDEKLTQSRREPKAGSELQQVETELQQARENASAASEKTKTREAMARELEDAEAALGETEMAMDRARKELAEAEVAARKAADHRRLRESKASEVKEFEKQWQDENEQVARIDELLKTEGALTKEDREEAPRAVSLQAELQTTNEQLKHLLEAMMVNEEELAATDKELTGQRIAHDVLRMREELDGAKTTLARVEDLENQAAGLRKELETIGDITQKDIKVIAKKEEEVKRLQGRLEAQGLSVKLTPKAKIKGIIKRDDGSEPFTIGEGADKSWKASRMVHIIIPKMMDLEVTSGSEDVKKLTQVRQDLKEEIRIALSRQGAVTTDNLREKMERKKIAGAQLEKLDEEISHHAPDGPAELRKRVAELTASIASGTESILIPAARESAMGEKVKNALNECVRAMRAAEERLKKAQDLRRQLKKQEKAMRDIATGLEGKLDDFKDKGIGRATKLDFIRKELQALRKDGLDDGERVTRKDRAAAKLEMARSALQGLESEVKEMEERPLRRLEEAKAVIEDLDKKNATLLTRTAELRGSIETLASNGDYTRLGEFEARIEELEGRKRRLETEAQALALLADLMEHHRSKAIADVAEPIRRIVDENLDRLIGRKYGGIKLDEGLKPCGVKVDGLEECPEIDHLSHGTREQIGILVMLAAAEVMARGDRLPVILDDPLAHTDAPRRRRALEILQEAAERLQIIVLTCHPEDYAGLVGSNRIELQP